MPKAAFKRCTGCLQPKALDQFPKHKGYPGGREYRCRDCLNAHARAKYRKRKPTLFGAPKIPGELVKRHQAMTEQTPEAFEAFFNEFSEYELPAHARQWVKAALENKRLLLNVPPRHSKALALDTPILTTRGWKTMGTIEVGDRVFDDRGHPTAVIAASEVFRDRPVYRVRSDDGAEVLADGEHLWAATARLRGTDRSGVFTTEELLKADRRPKIPIHRAILGKTRGSKRYALHQQYRRPALPVGPYTLGYWLGDGTTGQGSFTTSEEDRPHVWRQVQAEGHDPQDTNVPLRWRIPYPFTKALAGLGVLKDKHIPARYLVALQVERRALLQGLMDSDGSVSPAGQATFSNTNERLARDVQRLVWSLGHKAFFSKGTATLNGVEIGPVYRVSFYMKDCASIPRKQERTREASEKRRDRYVSITPAGRADTRCIAVANPRSLYLAGEGFLVTHNTTIMAIWFSIWQFACNRDTQIIIVSKTTKLGEKIARKIAFELEYNRALNAAFGRFRPSDSTRPWRVASGELEVEGKNLKVRSGDLSLQIRGSGQQIFGMEADWIIADDVTDQRIALSDAQSKEEELWFLGDVMSRLSPDGKAFCIGQRVHANDLYGKLAGQVDEGEFTWHLERTPAVLDWTERVVLWPEVWPFDKLMESRRSVGDSLFNCLYQQTPETSGEFVPRWWIEGNGTEEHPGCLDVDRAIGQGWRNSDGQVVPVVRVMSVDPSPTQYAAIIIADIVYQQQATEFWCSIVDIRRDKMGQRAMLENIIDLWQRHQPTVIIFESNSVKWLHEDVMWNQITSMFNQTVDHATGQNKNDQLMGVWSLAADIESGRIRFPYADESSRAASNFLIDELLAYPNGRTNDCVMALWFIKYSYRQLIPHDAWYGRFLGRRAVTGGWNHERIREEGKWAAYA